MAPEKNIKGMYLTKYTTDYEAIISKIMCYSHRLGENTEP